MDVLLCNLFWGFSKNNRSSLRLSMDRLGKKLARNLGIKTKIKEENLNGISVRDDTVKKEFKILD